ncbi:MAG: GntR family transcriptional regulator [Bryobacteraceae bacterium]|jgi:GntR family transcriptional regulator
MVSMNPLDKSLPVPLYHQLECVLRQAIESGEYQAGQQLPNEDQLAERFAVSKITVRQALHDLANHGYVRREQGRGTFVSKLRLDQGPHELLGFNEEMRRRRLVPATKVLKIDVILAGPAIAGPLELEPRAAVVRLKRLRLADGEPMGVQTAHIPSALAPGLETEDFENRSLYDLLRSRGLWPARARETHCASVADRAAARLLRIPAGTPVFAAERITFLANGKPFELVNSVMRGDRYSIVLDLAVDSGRQDVRYAARVARGTGK